MARSRSAQWRLSSKSAFHLVVWWHDEEAKDTRRHVSLPAALQLLERWMETHKLALREIDEALGETSSLLLSTGVRTASAEERKKRIAEALRSRRLIVLGPPEAAQAPASPGSPEASRPPAPSATSFSARVPAGSGGVGPSSALAVAGFSKPLRASAASRAPGGAQGLKHAPPAPRKFQVPLTEPIKIEFIQGDSTTAEPITQFVNLPRQPQWVDGSAVTSTSRLGRQVGIRISLAEVGSDPVIVRLEPTSQTTNVTYDSSELRTKRFTMVDASASKSYSPTSLSVQVPEDDFTLPVAGGDEYRFVVRQGLNEARSQVVKTERLIYCLEMVSRGATRPISDRIMGRIKEKFQDRGIRLQHLHKTDTLPSFEFGANTPLAGDDSAHMAQLQTAIRAGIQQSRLPDRSQYTLPIIYVDSIFAAERTASGSVRELSVSVERTLSPGDSAKEVVIPIEEAPDKSTGVALSRDLYYHPGTTVSTQASWLRKATITLPGATKPTVIANNLIQPVRRTDADGKSLVMFNAVRLDLSGLITKEGTAKIELSVVPASHLLGGFEPRINMVLIVRRFFKADIGPPRTSGASSATVYGPAVDRSAYVTVSSGDMEETLIHEIAHGLGLKHFPDLTKQYAFNLGGFHCCYPLTRDQLYKAVESRDFSRIRCIMGPDDSNGARRSARDFCAECSMLLRKADLTGWNRSLF
ncbi:MAG TPA: hypothetical protein VK539_37130 [Myxococcaceae bacterium]|nr:hypothetical protein [Myxococcaceae bacterium]